MLFTGILGDPGTGKTSLMTHFLYCAYKAGHPVIANYHLKFKATYMTFKELAASVGDEKLRRAIIGIDELSEGADSYNWLDMQPRQITKLVSQLRKMEAQVFYNDQRFNKVIKRLRDITDGFFLMDDNDAPHPNKDYQCACIFNVIALDKYFHKTGEFTFRGVGVHGLYDSKEIINSGY